MTTAFTHGTKIEIRKGGFGYPESFEPATIITHGKGKRKDYPAYPVAGYHRVRFADGGHLAVHETSFRVVA